MHTIISIVNGNDADSLACGDPFDETPLFPARTVKDCHFVSLEVFMPHNQSARVVHVVSKLAIDLRHYRMRFSLYQNRPLEILIYSGPSAEIGGPTGAHTSISASLVVAANLITPVAIAIRLCNRSSKSCPIESACCRHMFHQHCDAEFISDPAEA